MLRAGCNACVHACLQTFALAQVRRNDVIYAKAGDNDVIGQLLGCYQVDREIYVHLQVYEPGPKPQTWQTTAATQLLCQSQVVSAVPYAELGPGAIRIIFPCLPDEVIACSSGKNSSPSLLPSHVANSGIVL